MFPIPLRKDGHWNEEGKKAAEIRSGEYIVFGVYDGERIVGQIMLLPELNCGRMVVDSFHVSREYRRQGIGRALFVEAKKEAKRQAAKALYISACSSRKPLIFTVPWAANPAGIPSKNMPKKNPLIFKWNVFYRAVVPYHKDSYPQLVGIVSVRIINFHYKNEIVTGEYTDAFGLRKETGHDFHWLSYPDPSR